MELKKRTKTESDSRVNSRSRIDGIARTLLQQRAAVYRNSASSLLERATINKACRIAVSESIEEIAVDYYTNLFRSTVSVSRIPTPTQEVAPRIEEWEVERTIRQMKPRKAPGPDRISADFLKSASHTIIKQLTKRFNKYLDAQRIPD
ncbi:hypothetical protein V3C99_012589 [Haemonchus contortus]|uniref:Transposase n=1 Tax=Haemonchus contortus TaxID=6289 RepID=A0A7I4Y2K4_HAECO